jgi:hypothetical protein
VTVAASAARSADANVGSRRANTSPARTRCPSCTSIERTIAVSRGCTRIVADRETTIPRAVTTWSIGINALATIRAATMPVIIHEMPRAERGMGALMMAVDGHWNSRIAGRVGSFLPARCQVGTRLFDATLLIVFPDFGANVSWRKPQLGPFFLRIEVSPKRVTYSHSRPPAS